MRHSAPTALVLAAVLVAHPVTAQSNTTFASNDGSADVGAPTFYADVVPILQQNCQACHQDEGKNMGGLVAPFPLVSYEDVRRYASRIARAVGSGSMPPWSAASQHAGVFKDERTLAPEEKATLLTWVENGSPAGNPSDAPPQPAFLTAAAETGGWSLGEPDLILSFPDDHCLADDMRDEYINIPVEITEEMMPEDRWISSVEYRNGPAVHHIISAVGGLVPGAEPSLYEEGYGRVFREGPRTVRFQMHFNKEPGPGTALCTNIQAGIRFKEAGEVITHMTSGDDLMMRSIRIPAGDPSYSHSTEYTFEEDVRMLGFMPHMHLRGKAALYEVTYPSGEHEVLLHVPKYDFNWQHSYDFIEPPLIPAGSTLQFTLWWDNSADNPANPDPTEEVTWGLPTHAEMSQGYMRFERLDGVHFVVGEPIPENLEQAPLNEGN